MSKNKQEKPADSELDLRIRKIICSHDSFEQGSGEVVRGVSEGRQDCVDSVTKVFASELILKNGDPQKKFYGLLLLKLCMDTKREQIVEAVCNKTQALKIIEYYSKYKKESSDENRGRTIFDVLNKQGQPLAAQSEEVQLLGARFLKLVLECIYFWRQWWPTNSQQQPSKYQLLYESALKDNVTFHKIFLFFRQDAQPKFSFGRPETGAQSVSQIQPASQMRGPADVEHPAEDQDALSQRK